MARLTIQRSWPDGDLLTISVKVEESFPDAVAECKRAALDAFSEALASVVADPETEK